MVNGCLVLDCTSEWYPNCGVRFHAFPSDVNRRNQWLNVVPLKHQLKPNSKICSLHFNCSDYTEKGNRLKTEAIPWFYESEANDQDTAKNPAGKTQILEILLREKCKENKKLLEIYESTKRSTKEQAITPSYVSVDHDYFLQTPNYAKPPSPVIVKTHSKAPEVQNSIQDRLKADQRLQLSVDRNHNSKQLLITIDATPKTNVNPLENNLNEVKSEPNEINVPGCPNEEMMPPEINLNEVKSEPIEIINVPGCPNEEIMPPENNLNEVKSEPIEIINVPGCPNEEIMGNPDEFKDTNSHTRLSKDHDRSRLIIESKKLRSNVEKLERTVYRLKKQLEANKIRDSKMKIVLEKVKNYINNSEIDNILNGRFKDLCKLTRKSGNRFEYTPDVIKFAVSLYSISPNAYNFVKKHVDLPRCGTIRKY